MTRLCFRFPSARALRGVGLERTDLRTFARDGESNTDSSPRRQGWQEPRGAAVRKAYPRILEAVHPHGDVAGGRCAQETELLTTMAF